MPDREIAETFACNEGISAAGLERRECVNCYRASVWFSQRIFGYDNNISYFQHLCFLQNVTMRKAISISIWKKAS
ncbi:MAG: hypothetical protein NXH88_11225 [Hyphomonas sp.]|nr:hypothetical protein [Hyphomonas sp.]